MTCQDRRTFLISLANNNKKRLPKWEEDTLWEDDTLMKIRQSDPTEEPIDIYIFRRQDQEPEDYDWIICKSGWLKFGKSEWKIDP